MPNIDIEPEVLDRIAAGRKGWLHWGLRQAGWLSVYYAIGAFAHVQFYRRDFDDGDLLSWAWLAAWPLGLIIVSLKWIVIAIAVVVGLCLLGAAGYFLWHFIDNFIWSMRLRRRRAKEEAGA